MAKKRETPFIEAEDGSIYLPPPIGWFRGWARHLWVKGIMNREPRIASSDYWDSLKKENEIKRLVENLDGSWEVISSRHLDSAIMGRECEFKDAIEMYKTYGGD